jgi:translation initiation factor 2 subunit 2
MDTTTQTVSNNSMPDELDSYNVDDLLDRVYSSISIDKKRTKIVQPIFAKKDRKSYIHNFMDVCKSINRDPEEVRRYLSRELNMETSFKENNSLKINAIVRNGSTIDKIIYKYVVDYVQCKSCTSCKTETQRVDRLTYLVCKTCGARVTITKDF